MMKYPEWIYRQSAALPYRRRDEGFEILLVTSRKGKRWLIPKGIVEPGLTPPASAAKEAKEEAGVEGEIWAHNLGNYNYRKWGGTCTVDVFPMQVTIELEEWPEAALRHRQWMPIKEAADRINQNKLSKLVRRLPKALKMIAKKDRRPSAEMTTQRHVIYLFRHAKSSWDDPTLEDMARPLAPRGQRACEVMRDYMHFADVHPDLILCSSAVRTRQTLEAVLPAVGEDITVKYDRGLYLGGVVALTKRLRRVPDEVTSVMMLGHNPTLQALAVSLTNGGDAKAIARLEAKFPTAGLATLVLNHDHWQGLAPRSCELHSFIVPRDLM